MKKTILLLTAIIFFITCSVIGWAAEPSIVGVWSMPVLKGKDQGKERLQVEIYEKDGTYLGKIVKAHPGSPAKALCTTCKKDRKDKPLMGMVILRDLKKEAGRYVDGKVYDVDEGKEYKCSVSLASPQKLKVTACLLFICDSHYWTRVK
jgi:uncharacterized protein (DUF2147 family)